LSLIALLGTLVSIVTGLVGGFYLGRYDSRETDIVVYESLATEFSKMLLSTSAALLGKQQPSDKEVAEYREKWYTQSLKFERDKRRSKWLSIGFVVISLIAFAISYILGA